MKHQIPFLVGLLAMVSCLSAQQQSEFPIGLYGGNAGEYDPDTAQLRSSLGITWIYSYGGVGSGTTIGNHSIMETNASGLKQITIRNNISVYAKSQRLEIEAEGLSSEGETKSFFQRLLTPKTGQQYTRINPSDPQDQNGWQAIVGSHQPGYMASDVSLKGEYHYSQTHYTATFVMKITRPSPPPPLTDQVAFLSVVDLNTGNILGSRQLIDSDFGTDYKAFEVGFTLPCAPPSLPPKYLAGVATSIQSTPPCQPQIDVRVYWNGLRTTWLDKVYIEDTAAHSLFPREGQISGLVDNVLIQDVQDFANNGYPLVKRMYMADEPYRNVFLPYNYIDQKILNNPAVVNLDPNHEGRGRGITASIWVWTNWFLQDAQPQEVMVDIYVLTPDMPSPSMTASQATYVGVPTYVSNTQYNDLLQAHWNNLENYLGSVAIQAKNAARNFWFTPQYHGVYWASTHGYTPPEVGMHQLRPPTGNEIQAQINIALALGAKGIFGYPYNTPHYGNWPLPSGGVTDAYGAGLLSPARDANNNLTDHSSNIVSDPLFLPGASTSNPVYTGYKEKWDSLSAINKKLKLLASTLLSLSWQETKSWRDGTVFHPTGAA